MILFYSPGTQTDFEDPVKYCDIGGRFSTPDIEQKSDAEPILT